MALAKMNRQDEAINYLKDAIRADPQNPLARFELASVLVSAGLLDDALKELLVLKVRRTSDDSFSPVVLICKACAQDLASMFWKSDLCHSLTRSCNLNIEA